MCSTSKKSFFLIDKCPKKEKFDFVATCTAHASLIFQNLFSSSSLKCWAGLARAEPLPLRKNDCNGEL